MKLVDTLEEQERLEKMLEDTKPPYPEHCNGLHYLLFTPFRYDAPYPVGSRFRRPGRTEGVFYCSASPATAVAEIVFSRMLFFAEAPGVPLPSTTPEYTIFQVEIGTERCLDLTRPPMHAYTDLWTSCDDYSSCQAVAEQARSVGAEVISYMSVRCPKGGLNYAVLTGVAFATKKPTSSQTWHIHLRPDTVVAKCELPADGLSFVAKDFAHDKRIAPLIAA